MIGRGRSRRKQRKIEMAIKIKAEIREVYEYIPNVCLVIGDDA